MVDLPEGTVRGWAVLSHGFTLGKDSPAASRISEQLAHEGIGTLRFDDLGLGDSEGDWNDGSFSRKVEDTTQAVRFMTTRGGRPISASGSERCVAPCWCRNPHGQHRRRP